MLVAPLLLLWGAFPWRDGHAYALRVTGVLLAVFACIPLGLSVDVLLLPFTLLILPALAPPRLTG